MINVCTLPMCLNCKRLAVLFYISCFSNICPTLDFLSHNSRKSHAYRRKDRQGPFLKTFGYQCSVLILQWYLDCSHFHSIDTGRIVYAGIIF